AIDKLFNLLPDLYRQRQARKKYRQWINDELIWKSQYELLNGLCAYEKIPLIIREHNKLNALLKDSRYRFDRINANLFSYDEADLIIMPVDNQLQESNDTQFLSDRTLEKKFEFNFIYTDVKDRIEVINELVTGQISDPTIYLNQKPDEVGTTRDRKAIKDNRKRPSPQRTSRRTPSPKSQNASPNRPGDMENDLYGFKRIRAYIVRMFTHYRRAIVLAYRSTNWTLLQNVCKSFTDTLDNLIIYLCSSLDKIFPQNEILALGFQTFYLASECLIDLLYRTKPFYSTDDQEDGTGTNVIKQQSATKINNWFSSNESSWSAGTFNFEQPMDRQTYLDLKFIRKFILKSLQSLYSAGKWEKLTTTAMKFNALSDHYFADLVSPLLIAAQNCLIQRVREHQGTIEQSHFESAIKTLGRPIHPEDFYSLRPEKLFQFALHADSASSISIGARLDPKGHNFYEHNNRALELISVPLDVEFSRKLLRIALDKTYFSSRSMIECRKLLTFYVYTQQLPKDFLTFLSISSATFRQNDQQQEQQQQTIEYRPLTAGGVLDFSPDSITTSPTTSVTKEMLIDVYEKLAKLLLGQNRRDQYCQIMNELGDLYYHCKKYK
ncbi:unnamed protein product, partial [Didymodactylos carnosus]